MCLLTPLSPLHLLRCISHNLCLSSQTGIIGELAIGHEMDGYRSRNDWQHSGPHPMDRVLDLRVGKLDLSLERWCYVICLVGLYVLSLGGAVSVSTNSFKASLVMWSHWSGSGLLNGRHRNVYYAGRSEHASQQISKRYALTGLWTRHVHKLWKSDLIHNMAMIRIQYEIDMQSAWKVTAMGWDRDLGPAALVRTHVICAA